MRLIIENDPQGVALWVSQYIAKYINRHFENNPDKPFVLGLPTGSTPLETYKELIKLNKNGEVSFKNVITFNMDEYVGLPEDHPESYHTFMWENFFNHIDIKPENVNILDGNAPDLLKECRDYEDKIKAAGGIDLFLCGVGADGQDLQFHRGGLGRQQGCAESPESTAGRDRLRRRPGLRRQSP